MNRTPIDLNPNELPAALRRYAGGAAFDSSCSDTARVCYIERDGGVFIKRAPKGALSEEGRMLRLLENTGLAPTLLDYVSEAEDWLVTRRIPGEDGISAEALGSPERLAETLGAALRSLHAIPPVPELPDRLPAYLAEAKKGRDRGVLHPSALRLPFSPTREEADVLLDKAPTLLKSETLIHGDACLPNLMLASRRVAGWLDWGSAGRSDRHIDLYWAAWSLAFNLRTDAWTCRLFDAYGRDRIDPDRLRAVAACEAFRP